MCGFFLLYHLRRFNLSQEEAEEAIRSVLSVIVEGTKPG